MSPLIILSGPSGSGKSTLIERLLADKTWPLRLSVSVTTRAAPPEGARRRPLPFLDEGTLSRGHRGRGLPGMGGGLRQLLRHAAVGGDALPPPGDRGPARHRRQGLDAGQAALSGGDVGVHAHLRPRGARRPAAARGTETEEAIQRRLAGARVELAFAPQYDFEVINDDLTSTLEGLRTIIRPLFEAIPSPP